MAVAHMHAREQTLSILCHKGLRLSGIKSRPNPNPDSQQIKPSQGQPNADKVEYAGSTTGPQLNAHMEKLTFSSIDALSAGALTMERRTAHMENIMTLTHNDKEDVTLATLISGPSCNQSYLN